MFRLSCDAEELRVMAHSPSWSPQDKPDPLSRPLTYTPVTGIRARSCVFTEMLYFQPVHSLTFDSNNVFTTSR